MIALLLPLFLLAQEETKTVVVEGTAMIGTDLAKARDEAIEDALRSAVEQGVGLLISSETLVKNFQVIEDRILSRSHGYVASYEIVQERKEGSLYRVRIKAVVKLGNLKDDLAAIGLLLRRKGLPRLMVLVDERNIGSEKIPGFGYDLNNAETAIMEVFMSKGFTFIDQAAAKRKLAKDVALAAIEDPEAAKRIGFANHAEVIIVGKAMAKLARGASKYLGDMKSCQADVNLRAINVETGEIIAVASAHRAAVHIDEISGGNEAIKKAAKEAAEQLMERILSRWTADVTSGERISLTVYGLTSFGDVDLLKREIEEMRGVKGVYSHGFEAGCLSLEVEYEGNGEALARNLAAGLPSFEVEIVSQTLSSLVIKVKKRGE